MERTRKILGIVLVVMLLALAMSISVFATDSETTNVAKIGDTEYATFDEAITAANAMTGNVTVEIYGKVEYGSTTASLTGAYDSISFVGKTDDAEISITRDGSNGYISGEGNDCTVNFTDLILSKPTGAYAGDAGFMNVYFSVYRVGAVNYTNCTFPDGACAQGCPVTYTSCNFANQTSGEYSLWVYANTTVTVTDSEFTGVRGVKMYTESNTRDDAAEIVITNTVFTESVTQKPAIVLTYGESVELDGNTYPVEGTFELDLDGAPNGTTITADADENITCVNDNGDCGVLVDGKIYTTVAQAAEVATSGSTVTLLHDSIETVEFAEGVTLDTNGYTAENVTVAVPLVDVNGTTYGSLQEALEAAVLAGDTVTVTLLDNIDLTETAWTPVYFNSYISEGANTLIIDGNYKTITGLSDMLFSGIWTGTKFEVKNLTIDNATIKHDVDDASGNIGVGAIVGNVSAIKEVVLDNVKLTNSHVEGGHWTGGFFGYIAGYSGNDGPVFTTVSITNSEVSNSTITGKGSVGGVVGHATGDAWTSFGIADSTVTGNTITSTGSSTNKAGIVAGTIGAAGTAQTTNGTTLTGGVSVSVTESGNEATSNGTTITTVYGRQGTPTGVLEITGGTYENYPIEENVSYAAPAEGYNIVANEDGTYGIVEAPKGDVPNGYVDSTKIWGETWSNSKESYVLKFYNGETLMGTAELNTALYAFTGDQAPTWHINFNDLDGDDEWWIQEWIVTPSVDNFPTRIVLCVDGVDVNEGPIQFNGPDDANKIYALAKDADGNLTAYKTLAEAIANGGKVNVVRDVEESITAIENVTLITTVDGGVTVTNTYEDEYIAFNNVTLGTGVTLNIPYVLAQNCENIIEGTLNVSYVYYNRYNAKTTIQNGGKVVSTGMTVVRYNTDAAAGIYIYGDGDDSTVEFSCGSTIGTYSGTFYAKDAVIEANALWIDYMDEGHEEPDEYADINATFENCILNISGDLRLYKEANLTLTNTSLTANKVQVRHNAVPTVIADANSSIKATTVENLAGATLNAVLGEDGTVSFINIVARIGDVGYATLKDAIAALEDGDTLTILAGEHSEGSIKFPPSLKNVTIQGEEGAILKDMTLMAYDGNAVTYEGITFDGITFDNSNISFTGQRTGTVSFKDWTIKNCVFNNVNRGSAAVGFNLNASEAMENFTFTGNVINGVTGGSFSGVVLRAAKGTIVITDNDIQGVAWNAIQLINSTADTVTIENNTLASNASEGILNLSKVTADTLTIKNNKFLVNDGQPGVCYISSADVSANYWGGNAPANLPEGVTYESYYGDAELTNLITLPKGDIQVGYVKNDYMSGIGAIYGEAVNVNAKESFVVKMYRDGVLVGTVTLNDPNKELLNGVSKSITWHAALTNDGDSYWVTEWVGGSLKVNSIPDSVELYVDETLVSTGEVILSQAGYRPVFGAIVDANGIIEDFISAEGYDYIATLPAYAAALNTAMANGGNIVLLKDITVTEKITVTNNVTLDLNGKTITTSGIVSSRVIVLESGCTEFVINANGGSIVSNDALSYGIVDVNTTANLTVNGGTYDFDTNNGGLFKFRNYDSTITLNNVTVYTNGQISAPNNAGNVLDVNGGTFKAENGYNVRNVFAFYVEGATATFDDITMENKYIGGIENWGGNVTITDCNISVLGTNSAPYLSVAVAVSGNGNVTIDGGNYSTAPIATSDANGQGVTHGSWTIIIMSSGGTMTINDGTFSNGYYNDGTGAVSSNPRGLISVGADTKYGSEVNANLVINGGTFNSIGNAVDCETIWDQDGEGTDTASMAIEITGGDFTNCAGKTIGGCDPISTGNPVEIAISGGTFAEAVAEEYCADGFIPTTNDDGTYGVRKANYVAEINSVKYESLADALNALKANGGTLVLLNNINESITLNYPESGAPVELTIDLNGFTVTSAESTLWVSDGYVVTVIDSSEAKTGKIVTTSTGDEAIAIARGGKVILEGGTIEGVGYGIYLYNGNSTGKEELVINGGEVVVPNGGIAIAIGAGKVTVNGGKVTCNKVPDGDGWNTVVYENGTLVITDGEFLGTIGNWGVTSISGGTFSYCGDVNDGFNDEHLALGYISETDENGVVTVVAAPEAPNGFVYVYTYNQLIEALKADNAKVIMANDITATATQSSGYGVAGIVLDAGDILDGDGHKLTINYANGTWDCAIAMRGGEVRNLTIAGACRGVFMPGANGDVVIDNCVFEDVIYTFNSDAGSKDYTVTIKNTALNGWTSFSDVHKSVTFDTCTFGEGAGYAFCRPYQSTTFVNCDFDEGYELDTSKTADNALAFNDCTYAGEAINAENAIDLFYNGGKVLVDGTSTDYTRCVQITRGEEVLQFTSIEAALAAAQAGDEIVIISDAEIAAGEVVTINNVTLTANEGVTLTNNGTIYLKNATIKGVTIVGTTSGVIKAASGTNTIEASTIDIKTFQVGTGKEDANVAPTEDVVVNVVNNSVLKVKGAAYDGWVGSKYNNTITDVRYILNIENSAAAFGYLHVSKDGILNVTGSVADDDKLHMSSSYNTFYVGNFIVNGVATLKDTDVRVQYGKISVDNADTVNPGTLNVINTVATFAAEGSNNTALKWWNSGIVNIENSTVGARTPSITATGALNITNSTFDAKGTTVTNNGAISVSGTSTINATVTGAGWVYMHGVTLDANTNLVGAKVRFASGTNTINGSTITDGYFQVGIGAYNGVDANVDTENGVVVNVYNAVISANGETYAGWIGTGYYDTDDEKTAVMNGAKYVLNIYNSIAEFGYLHISNDGELNVNGNAVEKKWYNNSDYSFYAGEIIVNGTATFTDTDVLALYTKVSCDNGTSNPGTINVAAGTEYEAERHNGAIDGTNFVLYKTGVVNVAEGADLYIGEYTSISEDAKLNIAGTVTALGTITNNGTITITSVNATLTTPTTTNVVTDVVDYKTEYVDGKYVLVQCEYVAEVNGTKYESLAEAAANAKSGDEIVLLADAYIAEGTDVTIPDGVILNGNGYSIFASGADYNTTTDYGYVVAGGNLTIKGITKIEKFSASLYNHVITIGEGASLQVFGQKRVSLGYGSSFDITGTIDDAKTADKSTVTPSLVISAGISIVGSNDTYLNANNAYVVLGSSSSKNSNAGGEFDITFTNCIVDFTSQFTLATPKYDTLNPTFNVTFEDSVVTTGAKMCLAAPGSNVVVDNSSVNLGTYLHNSGNLEIKNGSTFVGSMIQYGENGGNSGTITVDNASFTIKNNNSAYAMDGNNTGKLILKNGATASVDYITETEVTLGVGSTLTSKSSELEIVTEPGYEAVYENGAYTIVKSPVAQIGDVKYTTLEEAFKAATSGCTIEILDDVTIDYKWDCRDTGAKFTVPVTINGNNHTIKFTGAINDMNWNTVFRFEADATVKNLTIDASEATEIQRGISAKYSITVDNCTFIGNGTTAKRAIIFGEGAGADLVNVTATITNSKFVNWSLGVSDNQSGKDAKEVTITGNTFTNASALISASDKITFTGNTLTNGYVNISSYTAADTLVVEATGNTLVADAENEIRANPENITADEGFALPVVKIGSTYYYDLATAISKAVEGDTVTLLTDIELDSAISFSKDITFTLDGNGYSIVPSANCTEAINAFNLGLGSDATVATRNYTIKNVVFENWTTDHVLRLQGVTATVDNCTFKNCNQADGLGLLTLTFCNATVTNCVFDNNVCVKAIDVNSWGDDSTTVSTIDGCTFTNNTCSGIGVIQVNDGNSVAITNNEFVGNTAVSTLVFVATNANVAGNYFEKNTVTGDSANKSAVLAGPCAEGEYEISINGNAFTDTEFPGAFVEDWSEQYGAETSFNLNGNYWNGGEPNYGSSGNPDVTIDNYYASYEYVDGNLVLNDKEDYIKYFNAPAYVSQDTIKDGWTTIWGQITFKATENFYVEIYSGETYLGKTSLVDNDKVLLHGNKQNLTWHAFIDGSDSWWNTEWAVAPICNIVPTNVKYFADGEQIGEGTVNLNGPDGFYPVVWAELRGVAKNIIATDENGNKFYGMTLDELFADTTLSGEVTVELLGNVVAESKVNVSYAKDIKYNFVTDVAEGVTIDFEFTDDWNRLPKFSLGENITMNVAYLYVIGGDINVSGTINTNYFYLYGTGAGVTIEETGVVNANVAENKTVQVKGGTVLTVKGVLNTSTLNVWTGDQNNSKLVVTGENAEVNATWVHAWNGYDGSSTQEIVVENGATLTSTTGLQADRGSELTVDNATVNANITLGYTGNVGTLVESGDSVINGEINMNSTESTITSDGGLNVTTSIADHKVVYEDGTYKVVPCVYVVQVGDVKYESLQEAFNAVQEGGTITILAGEHEFGVVEFPVTLKNVTITGEFDENGNKLTVLKNSAFVSAVLPGTWSAPKFESVYENITIDGIVFDNSYIKFTGWANVALNQSVSYADWTINNCEFMNNSTEAAVYFNLGTNEYMNNFTFTNNIIDGVTGTYKSGLGLNMASGTITITGNTIQNVAWNAIQLQNVPDDATVVITDNILSSNADEGIVNLYNNDASITFKMNQILTTSDTQPALAYIESLDVSENYWGGSAPANLTVGLIYTSYYAGVDAEGNLINLVKVGMNIYATNMTLGTDLSISFYYNANYFKSSNYYAVITKHHDSTCSCEDEDVLYYVPFNEWTNNGSFKQITVNGIAAKEMICDVFITIYEGTLTTAEDGTVTADGVQVSNEFKESVVSYVNRAFEYYTTGDGKDVTTVGYGTKAEFLTLMADMLVYGAAAQNQFGHYMTKDVVDAETGEITKVPVLATNAIDGLEAYIELYATKTEKDENGEYIKPTMEYNPVIEETTGTRYFTYINLDLENTVHYNLYFANLKGVENVKVEYTFTHHDETVHTFVSGKDFELEFNGDYLMVSVDDLAPADLRLDLVCKVYVGDTVVSTVTTSAEDYCALAVNYLPEDQAPLYENIMKYADSAYAYFH